MNELRFCPFFVFVLCSFAFHNPFCLSFNFTRFFSSWKSCWPGHCVYGTHRLCYYILKTHPCRAIDFRMNFKVLYLVLYNLASFYLLTKSPKHSNLKKNKKNKNFLFLMIFWTYSPTIIYNAIKHLQSLESFNLHTNNILELVQI